MRASRDDEDRPCEKHLMLIIQTVVLLIFVGLVKCEYTCGIEKRCIDQKAMQRCSAPKCSPWDSHQAMVDSELVTCASNIRGAAIRIAGAADTYDSGDGRCINDEGDLRIKCGFS
jgi:hypothetical protein